MGIRGYCIGGYFFEAFSQRMQGEELKDVLFGFDEIFNRHQLQAGAVLGITN